VRRGALSPASASMRAARSRAARTFAGEVLSRDSLLMTASDTKRALRRSPLAAQGFLDATRALSALDRLFQLLRLEMGNECIDHRTHVPVHEILEAVDGYSDAVIGHPVLREIVRS